MLGINKVTLLGHAGQDPEIRYLPDGRAACNLRLATSERWKDRKTGERKEATEWHNVSAFGGVAEVIGEYVRKGAPLYIEGKLQTRKWQDKEGHDRYTTEIVVSEIRLLGDRPAGDRQQERPAPQQQSRPAQSNGGSRGQPTARPAQDPHPFDDSIPF